MIINSLSCFLSAVDWLNWLWTVLIWNCWRTLSRRSRCGSFAATLEVLQHGQSRQFNTEQDHRLLPRRWRVKKRASFSWAHWRPSHMMPHPRFPKHIHGWFHGPCLGEELGFTTQNASIGIHIWSICIVTDHVLCWTHDVLSSLSTDARGRVL